VARADKLVVHLVDAVEKAGRARMAQRLVRQGASAAQREPMGVANARVALAATHAAAMETPLAAAPAESAPLANPAATAASAIATDDAPAAAAERETAAATAAPAPAAGHAGGALDGESAGTVETIGGLLAHRCLAGEAGEPPSCSLQYLVRWTDATAAEDEWFGREELLQETDPAAAALLREYEAVRGGQVRGTPTALQHTDPRRRAAGRRRCCGRVHSTPSSMPTTR
jgi:hypothetical protein